MTSRCTFVIFAVQSFHALLLAWLTPGATLSVANMFLTVSQLPALCLTRQCSGTLSFSDLGSTPAGLLLQL